MVPGGRRIDVPIGRRQYPLPRVDAVGGGCADLIRDGRHEMRGDDCPNRHQIASGEGDPPRRPIGVDPPRQTVSRVDGGNEVFLRRPGEAVQREGEDPFLAQGAVPRDREGEGHGIEPVGRAFGNHLDPPTPDRRLVEGLLQGVKGRVGEGFKGATPAVGGRRPPHPRLPGPRGEDRVEGVDQASAGVPPA